ARARVGDRRAARVARRRRDRRRARGGRGGAERPLRRRAGGARTRRHGCGGRRMSATDAGTTAPFASRGEAGNAVIRADGLRVGAAPDPVALYEAGLAGAGELWARRRDGSLAQLPLQRWLGPLSEEDDEVLARAVAPVLDIGCGPG